VRWLLFGDELDDSALEVTMRAVGRASLRSIGGFRASIGAQHRLDTLAALGDVPAAVLVGDRDRLTPPPCAESIAEALPQTELTGLPGAGHMLMLELLPGVHLRSWTARRRARRTRGPGTRGGPTRRLRPPPDKSSCCPRGRTASVFCIPSTSVPHHADG
jgi:hypothetical protein